MKLIIILSLVALSSVSHARMRKFTVHKSEKLSGFFVSVEEAQKMGIEAIQEIEMVQKRSAAALCNKQASRPARQFEFKSDYVKVDQSWINGQMAFTCEVFYTWSCMKNR